MHNMTHNMTHTMMHNRWTLGSMGNGLMANGKCACGRIHGTDRES